MRNWLVLGRRCKLRTNASWPPTVRGWTACTPAVLHDTSATMPPTTMIVPCAFLSYFYYNFINEKVFLLLHRVISNQSQCTNYFLVVNIHNCTTCFASYVLTSETSRRGWLYIRWILINIIYRVASSRPSCDNSGTFYSDLCAGGGRRCQCVC